MDSGAQSVLVLIRVLRDNRETGAMPVRTRRCKRRVLSKPLFSIFERVPLGWLEHPGKAEKMTTLEPEDLPEAIACVQGKDERPNMLSTGRDVAHVPPKHIGLTVLKGGFFN